MGISFVSIWEDQKNSGNRLVPGRAVPLVAMIGMFFGRSPSSKLTWLWNLWNLWSPGSTMSKSTINHC